MEWEGNTEPYILMLKNRLSQFQSSLEHAKQKHRELSLRNKFQQWRSRQVINASNRQRIHYEGLIKDQDVIAFSERLMTDSEKDIEKLTQKLFQEKLKTKQFRQMIHEYHLYMTKNYQNDSFGIDSEYLDSTSSESDTEED